MAIRRHFIFRRMIGTENKSVSSNVSENDTRNPPEPISETQDNWNLIVCGDICCISSFHFHTCCNSFSFFFSFSFQGSEKCNWWSDLWITSWSINDTCYRLSIINALFLFHSSRLRYRYITGIDSTTFFYSKLRFWIFTFSRFRSRMRIVVYAIYLWE